MLRWQSAPKTSFVYTYTLLYTHAPLLAMQFPSPLLPPPQRAALSSHYSWDALGQPLCPANRPFLQGNCFCSLGGRGAPNARRERGDEPQSRSPPSPLPLAETCDVALGNSQEGTITIFKYLLDAFLSQSLNSFSYKH